METTESFGAWVKTTRCTLGLTQQEFANLVYCAAVTVRKIEHNQLRPSEQLADSILEKVGVPLEQRAPLIRLARERRTPSFERIQAPFGGFWAQGE